MKYKIITLICLLMAGSKLFAQTRFFSAGYSTIPYELTGGTEDLVEGGFGISLATHKFKTTQIMRGFTFGFNQLGVIKEWTNDYYDYNTNTYIETKHKEEIKVSKLTFGYESIRLFGRAEIDDAGAFYGTFGYYLIYNMAQATYTTGDKTDPPVNSETYISPVDIAMKGGIGYQHMIGKQFAVYIEGKAYFTVMACSGYEWGLGVRYRGLGKR